MQVKGTGIKTTKDFVKSKFSTQFDNWLNSLPKISKDLYIGASDISQWYPIEDAYIVPVQKITELFYNGNAEKSGMELGQFSAEIALKGVYKVFLLIANPNFMMKRAAKIISTYYMPSEVQITNSSSKHVTLEIVKFEKIDLALEYRIIGWCKRALELAHCNKVEYKIASFLSKGNEKTIIEFCWN